MTWEQFWERFWQGITSAIPVERWLRAVGNLLRLLVLVTSFAFLSIGLLIVKSWGLTPTHRFVLIIVFAGVWLAVVVVVMILASRSADVFYNPYERSMAFGTRFGNEETPLTRAEAEALPNLTEMPALPSPTDTKQLPPSTSGEPKK